MCLAVQRTRTCDTGEERHILLELLTSCAWQCSESEPLRTWRRRRFFALFGVLCDSVRYVFKPDGTANPKLRSLRRQKTDYGKQDGRSQVTCRKILSERHDSPIRPLRRDTSFDFIVDTPITQRLICLLSSMNKLRDFTEHFAKNLSSSSCFFKYCNEQ